MLMTEVEKIAELRKLGKLTIVVFNNKATITLTIGNFSRKQTSIYGVVDALNELYKKAILLKPLIEALNCE